MDGALVFADHVELQKFGEHTRELHFPEPIALQSIKVIRRNEKLPAGASGASEFEGRTYPDVRAIGLEVFAADVMAANSTMLALQSSSLVTYDAPGSLVTNSVVLRGKFIKLSIAIYGQLLPSETAIPQPLIAQHLKPSSTFEDKLDMADIDNEDEDMGDRRDVMKETNFEFEDMDGDDFEASVPSFVRALGLGAVPEAAARLLEHSEWLASLHNTNDVLEAEVVEKLEALSGDIVSLAQRVPENAGHVHQGPALARSLLCLISRCMDRLEFRPLRAALQALTTCLISATAAAELLSKGLDVVVAILKTHDGDESLKLAALQVLLQLSSHVPGMEAVLGWSDASISPTPYEVVLSLVLDGMPGQPRSEFVALTLLRRSGLYEALSRFDDCCSKLEEVEGKDAPQKKLHSLAAEALQDIAGLIEYLSQPVTGRDLQSTCFLLEDELLNGQLSGESQLPSVLFGGCGAGLAANDPFGQGQHHLYGFLESFLTGRRLLPGLCVLLRRLRRMPPEERLLVFYPFQRLICTLLSCTGGPQFLSADTVETGRKLPAVPRFPATLVRDLGAPQLAALVALHVKALRLSVQLVTSTRQGVNPGEDTVVRTSIISICAKNMVVGQPFVSEVRGSKGRGGLLPEEHAFPVLAALHRLCVKGSAGRCAVVYAFRSVFFAEWLIRQIDGRLDEALPTRSQVQPSLRHLVAILHALVLSDPSGAAAERFGTRILALANKAIVILEKAEAEGDARASLLEFALDSEGAEGGLGKAVQMGRQSADLETLKNLRELAAQLKPWRPEEESSPGPLKDAKLMSSMILAKGARSLKRSANEERGSRRMALVLGGHAGAANGIEIPEVDFRASESVEHGDLPAVADDHERFPSDDLTELPLVAVRVLCQRAAAGSKEALGIVLHDEAEKSRDGLAQLVPWLIRCAGALNLNLEATILREDKKAVASIYSTRRAHLQLLEAVLPTCVHLLSGLRDAGLAHFRHTELCQTLLLLAQRLTSGLSGLAPRASFNSDPEFRLLWRHCLVLLCKVFRLWFQAFPKTAGGQLLLPLLRHARVLPTNFSGGLMLLATCGTLQPVLPTTAFEFSLQFTNAPGSGDGLHSRMVLLPTGTRAGNHAVVSLRHVQNGSDGGGYGQFRSSEVDWEGEGSEGTSNTDPLVQVLGRERETATAQALGLVEMVNSRRERLSLDDVGELLALVAESALTSDAFLHLCTAKVMEKLTVAGLPVLEIIRRLAEAALNGVVMETEGRSEGEDNFSGGAARDPRDARAVSRLLLLLAHFGALSNSARLALTEHSVETLCQSVLAHSPATSLPPMAFSQSIRLLSLMFASNPSAHSVPKFRMVAKAVNLLINKAPDSHHNASTVCAALELLIGLCTPQWLCLNLLFSGAVNDEDEKVDVTVSNTFKLERCMQRLAQELSMARRPPASEKGLAQELSMASRHSASEKGSEDEASALEELTGWLNATELMVSLQRVVLRNCPTSSIFLEVVLEKPEAPPASLFQDLIQIAQDIPDTISQHILDQVAQIFQAIGAFRKELQEKPSEPVPNALPVRIFAPPNRGKRTEGSKGSLEPKNDRSGSFSRFQEDCKNAVAETVSLLDDAADLESSAEWASVVELDSTESDDTKMEWDFDAGMLRKKRLDFLEKFESDRRAKRLKQQQEKQQEKQRMERAEEKAGPAAPSSQATATDLVPKDAAPRQSEKPERPETKKASDSKVNPAEALHGFLQDHPEFMRVLQNPKKCLADPRVKKMFVAELQNYPAVKSFLASQGLQL
eukprot:Skav212437  [mRNA]  locus=scaffold5136:1313:7977:+ [translate_table: standard]